MSEQFEVSVVRLGELKEHLNKYGAHNYHLTAVSKDDEYWVCVWQVRPDTKIIEPELSDDDKAMQALINMGIPVASNEDFCKWCGREIELSDSGKGYWTVNGHVYSCLGRKLTLAGHEARENL